MPLAVNFFKQEIAKDPDALQLNMEYRMGAQESVSLMRKPQVTEGSSSKDDAAEPLDLGRHLVANGLCMVEQRKERRLSSMVRIGRDE